MNDWLLIPIFFLSKLWLSSSRSFLWVICKRCCSNANHSIMIILEARISKWFRFLFWRFHNHPHHLISIIFDCFCNFNNRGWISLKLINGISLYILHSRWEILFCLLSFVLLLHVLHSFLKLLNESSCRLRHFFLVLKEVLNWRCL